MYIEKAIEEMKLEFKDFPWGIEHTGHVLGYAEAILDGEAIGGSLRETTALAAVLHDIGFIEAQKKHGSMAGPFQELEGPAVAQAILERIGVPEDMSKRVCHIVGHHHTFASIDGVDFQILWEADTLENLLYNRKDEDETFFRQKVLENFKTASGRKLAYERLGIRE
jgi:hypothetical protein